MNQAELECPYCDQELDHIDTFGDRDYALGRGGKKAGDIFWCENEDCEGHHFHVLERETELREGYPC